MIEMKLKRLTPKYGLELRFWIVALILFSGVFSLMVVAFHDAATNYGATNVTNPTIEARYNQLDQQKSLVGNIQNATSGKGGLQVLNTLGTIFTATIGVLNLVLSSLVFIPTVFGGFASDFGIPTQVSNLFFVMVGLIVTTLVIFAILNAIKQ